MKLNDYLRAKEALRLATEIGLLLENDHELTAQSRYVLDSIIKNIDDLFFTIYNDGREQYEPENIHFHTGLTINGRA